MLLIATGVGTTQALARGGDAGGATASTAGVLHMPTVKPLDAAALREARGECAARGHRRGAHHDRRARQRGDRRAGRAHGRARARGCKRIGIPDVFAKDYGSQEWLMEGFGIRAPQNADCVRKAIAS